MSDEEEADLDQTIEDIAERSIEEALYEVDDEIHENEVDDETYENEVDDNTLENEVDDDTHENEVYDDTHENEAHEIKSYEKEAPERKPAADVSVSPARRIPSKTEQEYELDYGMVRELSNQSCGQPILSFMADHQHPRSRNRCLLSGDDASVTELLTLGRPHSRYTMCELNDDPDLTVDSEVTDYGELFPEFGRLGGNGSCEKLRLTEDELAMAQEVDKTSDEDGGDGYKDGKNRDEKGQEGRTDEGRRVKCLKTVTRRTRHSSTCRTADGRTSGKIYTAKRRHIQMVSSDDGCRDEEGRRRSRSRGARSGSESGAERSGRRSLPRKTSAGSRRRSNGEYKRSSRRGESSGENEILGKSNRRTTPSKSTRTRSVEGSDGGEGRRSSRRYSNSSRTRSSYDKDPSSHRRSKSKSSHSRRSTRRSEYDDDDYDEDYSASVSAGAAGRNKSSPRSWRIRGLPMEESFDPENSSYSRRGWDHDWEYDREEEDVLSDVESKDPSSSRRSHSQRKSSNSRKSSYPSASAASEDERRSEVYKGDAWRHEKVRKKSSRSRRRCWEEESVSRRGRRSVCEHFSPYMMPCPPVYNPHFSSCYPSMEECRGEVQIFYSPPPYPVMPPYLCRQHPVLSRHSTPCDHGRSRRIRSASRRKARSCPSE